MTSPAPDAKQAILEPVLRLAGARLAGAAAKEAREFIAGYYDQVDAEDLNARASEDLYGAALSHLTFARRFATGTPKVRVYNPRVDEHGWSSPHTVVEIVNDDMPFLVDSVTMELNRQGHNLHLLLHPLVTTVRDREGMLKSFAPAGREGARESFIHIEVDRDSDAASLKALGDGLLGVLGDVRAAVEDWQAMKGRMQAIVGELDKPPKGMDADDIAETREFLAWAVDDNFTFIGFREYELAEVDGEDQLKIVPRSGLGVLREPRLGGISQSFRELPAAIRALAREPRPLVLTKANSRATVHRTGYLDYVGVKKFDAKGRVTGERRFVGLYTSAAYHADPREIPLLRRKVARVLERAGFPAASHGYKNLVSMLQAYPRDELFQVDDDLLLEIAFGVLRLGDRRRTRLFVRRDVYGRFFSCLIYLPRENYNTDVRMRIQEILRRRLSGTSVEFAVQLSDAVLARIHMLVRTSPKDEPRVDERAIEAEIAQASRRWEDDLKLALTEAVGEEKAVSIGGRYGKRVPRGLPRVVLAARGRARHRGDRDARRRRAHRGEPLPAGGGRRAHAAASRLQPRRAAAALGDHADPREHGARDARRGRLGDRARRSGLGLPARFRAAHGLRHPRRRGDQGGHGRGARAHPPRRDRERRLQPADTRRRTRARRRRRAARLREVPEADGLPVQPGLRGADAGHAPVHRGQADRALSRALRPGGRRATGKPRSSACTTR